MKETTLAGCVDMRETTRRGRAEQSPKQQQLEQEQHTTDNKSSDRDGATQQQQARTEVKNRLRKDGNCTREKRRE